MAATFSYAKTGLWYRPIIPVALKFGTKEINYLALIDSGADFNIFHEDIAKILGINSKGLKRFKFGGIKAGAGSEGEGYFKEIYVGVNNVFIKTLVVFSNDISDNGYGILGQQGFFNHHKVQFDYASRKIVVL